MKNFFEPDDEHDFHDMENVPQYIIERYGRQVEEILFIFDMQEFFVSDETEVRDFRFTPQELELYNHRLKEEYGLTFDESDFVWQIAEKIYENEF